MHGNRIRLRQQLEKERQELDRRREEEELIRQRNVIVSQSSNSLSIPQKPQPPQVTIEVPPKVLEVMCYIPDHLFSICIRYSQHFKIQHRSMLNLFVRISFISFCLHKIFHHLFQLTVLLPLIMYLLGINQALMS